MTCRNIQKKSESFLFVAGSPVADSPDREVGERESSGFPTPAEASASVEDNTVNRLISSSKKLLHVATFFE